MIAIIADDLTGAAEVAGVCLRYGLKVAFGVNTLPSDAADAWVIATDSRSVSSAEACKISHDLAVALKDAGISEVFKKTDSVIRGHIVDELTELMAVFGLDKAVLQTANPATGRCIRNGIYYVSGKALHETSFALDPDFPAFSSSVEELLVKRSERKMNIQTKAVSFEATGINVPDCFSEKDLKSCISNQLINCIYAGSAAFFAAYLEVMHGFDVKPNMNNASLINKRFLMICGSMHAQSHEFLKKVAQNGIKVCAFPECLLTEITNENDIMNWAGELADFWKKEGRMILTLGNKSIQFENSSKVLKERMALVLQSILEKCEIDELFIEGGATTFAVLLKQGWISLVPVQEFSPGVVRMKVSQGSNLYLTMKPGSYLWPKTILNYIIN